MKRVYTGLILAGALILVLAACDNPFAFNAFSNFDQPVPPSGAEDITALRAE